MYSSEVLNRQRKCESRLNSVRILHVFKTELIYLSHLHNNYFNGNNFRCFGMELTKNYDMTSFHDDLRNLYNNTGVKNEDTVFLFTDAQILQEEFLEDINNILNSGLFRLMIWYKKHTCILTASRKSSTHAGVLHVPCAYFCAFAFAPSGGHLGFILQVYQMEVSSAVGCLPIFSPVCLFLLSKHIPIFNENKCRQSLTCLISLNYIVLCVFM